MDIDQKISWVAIRIALVAFRSGKSVNAPSEEGRLLGEQFATFADKELSRRKIMFPNHVERCATCAFRKGTIANQCGATLLAALDCLTGEDIFMCHERKDHDCVGYSVLKHGN
jgi:hypothetical protein